MVAHLRSERTEETEDGRTSHKELKQQNLLRETLHRHDSLTLEAGRLHRAPADSCKERWRTIFHLAFQSIGVVYGDLGTSPLYVFKSTFPEGIKHNNDILGVLSLIIYTMVLIPLIKYVLIVLWANDNGDGGTFALYSLICRYARVSMIPNQQAEDSRLSNYTLELPSNKLWRAEKTKEKLEKSIVAKTMLFLVTILGTSMVIGDGVLTPCMSVLSAVGGIKEAAENLSQETVVAISIIILILLFAVQNFGTDKIGNSFAPIILLWFSFIGLIGIYNLVKYDHGVLWAFNPKYIIDYFKRNGKEGWISLGGVVLCITGTEAMFADLGHFSVAAIQTSFCSLVLPALTCAYVGQAAYLSKNPQNVTDAFYKSIPRPLYWPQFLVAVAAAVIASQAMISGSFAIISQSLSLGCFPRVKVRHTSAKYEGQVYIPEINYAFMIACITVTAGFRTTEHLGNAYGIAVVAVMVITTFMVALIMLLIWKTSIWKIGLFFAVFSAVEITYLSSVLYKFKQGGFLPLAFSGVLMLIMSTWHYVHKRRYIYELQNKVPSDYIKDLATNPGLRRVPGIGFLYSELVQGIPPILPHFISNIPSIHCVLVIVSIKIVPISKVTMEERFLFRCVEPRDYRIFRCVARYGYKDIREEPEEFEGLLVEHLKEFVRQEFYGPESDPSEQTESPPDAATPMNSSEMMDVNPPENEQSMAHYEENYPQQSRGVCVGCIHSAMAAQSTHPRSSHGQVSSRAVEEVEAEVQFIQMAKEDGVVYLLGETEVVAEPNATMFKKLLVNYLYDFIRRNVAQGEKIMLIPRRRLLKVGMIYEI